MRHPGRRFPGSLMQGDSLFTLYWRADQLCKLIGRGGLGYAEANELRNMLGQRLDHYKAVLMEHIISLPFDDQAGDI